MKSKNNTEMLQEEYVLKRLVYVNSAKHGYSEILLDTHMAMFGQNNAGKTASLAGTKLLLYPEVNFFKCEEKFKFMGKQGRFSMDESYDFYFPDAKSFLVLEVKNPEGVFCMILYKMTNYAYGRFFVPLTYNEIRHLFWDIKLESFADTLNIQAISKFIKENNGIQVTDPKEITHLMFSSFRGDKSKKRFCILPLKDGRVDDITAFKNIYQLAFETGNTETSSLPKALATLLEMGRSRDEERLDANLTQLGEEYSNLVKKQEWLQILLNTKPLFEQVKSDYESIKDKFMAYSKLFKSIEVAIIQAKHDYIPLFKETQAELETTEEIKEKLNDKITELNRKLMKENGAIESLEETLKVNSDELEKARKFIASHTLNSVGEIVSSLNENLERKNRELEGYRKEGGIKESLEKNISMQNKLRDKVESLRVLINNSRSTVLHQLSDDISASILISLNERIANISTILDNENKTIITCFTDLFGVDGAGYLTFLGKSVIDTPYKKFDAKEQLESWNTKLLEIEKERAKLEKTCQKQLDAIKNDNVSTLIHETEEEVKTISDNIKMVNGLASLVDIIERTKRNIKQKESSRTQEKITLLELQTASSKIKGEWNILQTKLKNLADQKLSFEQIEKYIQNSKLQSKPIDCEFDKMEPSQLSIEKAEALWALASNVSREFNQFNHYLRQLLTELPHPDIDTHKEYTNIDECNSLVRTYDNSFSTLEYDLHQHLNEIRSHNQLVSNQLNELKEAKILLTNFINEINTELNDKSVSNLSEIKLHLETDKRFESLLATLEKHNIQDNSLLDDQFYISLAKFVEAYFDKSTRRLKMHDIISSIAYHYRLEKTGELVTKSQSGGTTSTITAFVLSVLLKRITPPYVTLRMPIIVDEISTLDSKNTDAAIKQIADHGFSIFCATPSFSAFISQKVGRWIMIDRTIVKKPLVNQCYMHLLPSHTESFGEQINEAQS